MTSEPLGSLTIPERKAVVLGAKPLPALGERAAAEVGPAFDHDARGLAAGVGIDDSNLSHGATLTDREPLVLYDRPHVRHEIANGDLSDLRWPLPRSARARSARGRRGPDRRRPHQGSVRSADRRAGRHPRRSAWTHADAGPDRRACPPLPRRGESRAARRHAAHAADDEGRRRRAANAAARLYQRARRRRQRLRHQDGDRQRNHRRSAPVHRRNADQPDRRTRRLSPAQSDGGRMLVLLRPWRT